MNDYVHFLSYLVFYVIISRGDLSSSGLKFLELLLLAVINVCQSSTDEDFVAQLKRTALFLPMNLDLNKGEQGEQGGEEDGNNNNMTIRSTVFTSALTDERPESLKLDPQVVDIYASSVIQIVNLLWMSTLSTKKSTTVSTSTDNIDDEPILSSKVSPDVVFGICRNTFLFLLPYSLREDRNKNGRGLECLTLLQLLPERHVGKVLVSVFKIFIRAIRECGGVIQTAIAVKRAAMLADGDSLLRCATPTSATKHRDRDSPRDTKKKEEVEDTVVAAAAVVTKGSLRSNSTWKSATALSRTHHDWMFLQSFLGIFDKHLFTKFIRVLEAIAKGGDSLTQKPPSAAAGSSGSKNRSQLDGGASFGNPHITKLARQILYKVEEFQWKLAQILRCVDAVDQVCFLCMFMLSFS